MDKEPRSRRRIALVAHDNKKQDLLGWARYNAPVLARHDLYGTGTTGRLVQEQLGFKRVPARRTRLRPDGARRSGADLGRIAGVG